MAPISDHSRRPERIPGGWPEFETTEVTPPDTNPADLSKRKAQDDESKDQEEQRRSKWRRIGSPSVLKRRSARSESPPSPSPRFQSVIGATWPRQADAKRLPRNSKRPLPLKAFYGEEKDTIGIAWGFDRHSKRPRLKRSRDGEVLRLLFGQMRHSWVKKK
jgi:hypothetical protein